MTATVAPTPPHPQEEGAQVEQPRQGAWASWHAHSVRAPDGGGAEACLLCVKPTGLSCLPAGRPRATYPHGKMPATAGVPPPALLGRLWDFNATQYRFAASSPVQRRDSLRSEHTWHPGFGLRPWLVTDPAAGPVVKGHRGHFQQGRAVLCMKLLRS